MWILISWIHQKPADLDLHCFQKREYSFEEKNVLFVFRVCIFICYWYCCKHQKYSNSEHLCDLPHERRFHTACLGIYGQVTYVPTFRTLTVFNAKENDRLMVPALLCYSIAIDEK